MEKIKIVHKKPTQYDNETLSSTETTNSTEEVEQIKQIEPYSQLIQTNQSNSKNFIHNTNLDDTIYTNNTNDTHDTLYKQNILNVSNEPMQNLPKQNLPMQNLPKQDLPKQYLPEDKVVENFQSEFLDETRQDDVILERLKNNDINAWIFAGIIIISFVILLMAIIKKNNFTFR